MGKSVLTRAREAGVGSWAAEFGAGSPELWFCSPLLRASFLPGSLQFSLDLAKEDMEYRPEFRVLLVLKQFHAPLRRSRSAGLSSGLAQPVVEEISTLL